MLRFSPNPTKDLDIEGLRVALLNYIVAKQKNKDLIIRIEDINKEKNIEAKTKDILKTLDIFSLDYKFVAHQSQNIKHHTQMAMQLLLDKKAFNCFCSNTALLQDIQKAKENGEQYRYTDFCLNLSDEAKFECNAPFTVRIKRPENDIFFEDALKGKCSYSPFDVDSFIILDQDKVPTYNFSCAIDDMIFDITTIIRKDQYLDDTAKQIHIRKTLGYDKNINYIHLASILDKDTNQESTLSVDSLIEDGFLPAAIANYIVSLGFNTPNEIFTLEDAIKWFDITKISNANTSFDKQKLKDINKKHIEQLDDMRLSKIIGFADADIGKLAKIYLEECFTIKEIKDEVSSIFNSKHDLDSDKKQLNLIKKTIENAPYIETFEEFREYILQNDQLVNNDFDSLLRYILTGKQSGPDLNKIYPLIKNYIGEIV